MSGPVSRIERSVAAMRGTIDALRAEDVDPASLTVALAEVSGRIAKSDPNGAALLDDMAAILKTYAETIRAGNVMRMAQRLVDNGQKR